MDLAKLQLAPLGPTTPNHMVELIEWLEETPLESSRFGELGRSSCRVVSGGLA
jgi:hypothetical protein